MSLTGSIAGVGALTGGVIAILKRRKILEEFRRQMSEKRDATLSERDRAWPHLRDLPAYFD